MSEAAACQTTLLIVYMHSDFEGKCNEWKDMIAKYGRYYPLENLLSHCRGNVLETCNAFKKLQDLQPPLETESKVNVESVSFESLTEVKPEGKSISGMLFVGRGSVQGIENVHLTKLSEKAKQYGSTLIGLIGCDLGSERNLNMLMISQSRQWDNLLGFGFDQKMTLSMVEDCGVLQSMFTFLYYAKDNNFSFNRRLLRFCFAYTAVKDLKPFHHVQFINDNDSRESTFELGVDTYENKVRDKLPADLVEKYVELLEMHKWSRGRDGESTFRNFLDLLKEETDEHKLLLKMDEAMGTIGLQYVLPFIEKVKKCKLLPATISDVCAGDWNEIDGNQLAVAIARGYRGTSTFAEASSWQINLILKSGSFDDYKFRVAASVLSNAYFYLHIESEWVLYWKDQVIFNNWENPRINEVSVTGVLVTTTFDSIIEGELLHFSYLYSIMKDEKERWVNLWSENGAPLKLRDMLSLWHWANDNQSDLINSIAFENDDMEATKQTYTSADFKEALASLSKFVFNGETNSTEFDSKVFSEGDAAYGSNFPSSSFSRPLAYAESNIRPKKNASGEIMNKHLNCCRFVYAYVRRADGSCVGRLFYTDLHYGSFLCYGDQKFASNDYEALHKRPSPYVRKEMLRRADDFNFFPFEYCGVLHLNSDPSLSVMYLQSELNKKAFEGF